MQPAPFDDVAKSTAKAPAIAARMAHVREAGLGAIHAVLQYVITSRRIGKLTSSASMNEKKNTRCIIIDASRLSHLLGDEDLGNSFCLITAKTIRYG